MKNRLRLGLVAARLVAEVVELSGVQKAGLLLFIDSFPSSATNVRLRVFSVSLWIAVFELMRVMLLGGKHREWAPCIAADRNGNGSSPIAHRVFHSMAISAVIHAQIFTMKCSPIVRSLHLIPVNSRSRSSMVVPPTVPMTT